MNWFELINKAVDYIEDNISSDITSKDVASYCNVSSDYFAKTFSMITGYSMSEYIRNRRITLASYDISNTDQRIIDIALKYGYSSNEAFSRAFKRVHGINPSIARRNHITVFTHFPVLHYEVPVPNILSLRYDILTDIEYSFIGKSIYIEEENYEETQAFQRHFENEFKSNYPSNNLLYTVHYNLSQDNLKYHYLVGHKQDEYMNEELTPLTVKANKAIRFISSNITLDVIPELKKIIYEEWYKNDFVTDGNCEIEYVIPKEDNTFDFYYIVSIY